MGDWGIKISKDGASIQSANNTDYIYHSGFFVPKTYLVGTYNYTFPSDLSSVNIEITHNLGYRPCAWWSYDASGINSTWKGTLLWYYFYSSGGNTANRSWRMKSQTDKIIISYTEDTVAGSGYNPTGESWTFKYYVFIEPVE